MICYCDGGSSGNPGTAAIGYVAYNDKDNNRLVATHGELVGQRTNNVAEYMAILKALCFMQAQDSRGVIYSDSNIAIQQINKEIECKDEKLIQMREAIYRTIKDYKMTVGFRYTARENNKKADSIVNAILKEYRPN